MRTYFLHRCAEITLEDGYDCLEIVEGNRQIQTEGLAINATAGIFSKPAVLAVIKLYHGNRPVVADRSSPALVCETTP